MPLYAKSVICISICYATTIREGNGDRIYSFDLVTVTIFLLIFFYMNIIFNLCIQMSVLLEVILLMKDVLKYTTMELGGLFVMIIGAIQMAM